MVSISSINGTLNNVSAAAKLQVSSLLMAQPLQRKDGASCSAAINLRFEVPEPNKILLYQGLSLYYP
jgi:hypothetical protein